MLWCDKSCEGNCYPKMMDSLSWETLNEIMPKYYKDDANENEKWFIDYNNRKFKYINVQLQYV